MKLLEIENNKDEVHLEQKEDGIVQKKGNMFKAIFFILLAGICGLANSVIFKMVKRNDNASVIDYFIVRNSVSLVVYGLVSTYSRLTLWTCHQTRANVSGYKS